jgi:hypothetical protein
MINLKNFLRILSKDAGLSTRKMSKKIGLCDQALYRKQVSGNLTVKELQKCLNCNWADLVIVYKGDKYNIDEL